MPSNNEIALRQNVADLQAQVAFRNKAIKEMYALWGPIFQWGLLQAECKFGNNVQEFVLRKLKSLGAIEDQLESANALNADLQAQLAAANMRQAELVAELTKERARLDCVLSSLLFYAAPLPATVPDGWSIRREGDHIVIQKRDVGGVVVKQNPSEAREIPEAILWALANDLLQSAQEPKL